MGNATTSTNGDLVVSSFKIERDVYDRFRQIAAANRRSVSQEIRWAIDRHIEASTRAADTTERVG